MEGEPVTDSLRPSGFLAADLGHGPARPHEIGFVDPVAGLLVVDGRANGGGDLFVPCPASQEGREVGFVL